MTSTKRQNSPMKCQNSITMKKPKIQQGEDLFDKLSPKKSQNHDFGNIFDDDFDFDVSGLETTNEVKKISKLDLTEWTRCVVKGVKREPRTNALILDVQAEAQEDKENISEVTVCHLQGPWSYTHVNVDDVVSLQAAWDEQLNAFKVANEQGYCVINPNTLLSGTTVVGSLFCRRKTVLQDRFRGIDAGSKVMVIGSIVHELLQTVLNKGVQSYEEIDAVAQTMLNSREIAYMLYANQLTREETELEILKFVPNVVSFMEQYVTGQTPAMIQKDDFQGRIAEVNDIEENLWVPQLGLKGKIDVSVRIRRRNKAIAKDETNAIPLELKTGRATFSMEHRGQLTLYQMMLSATGRKVDSGLLLYLRDGIMREVQGKRNEQRDLIMLRNDLSHYLTQTPTLPAKDTPYVASEMGKLMQPFALPEPISHHSACGSCAYSTICCSFVKTDAELQLRESHPLQKVMKEVTAHLQTEDYEYFIRWCALIALEEEEAQKSNYTRSLWTDTPEQRQRNGRAILHLELQADVSLEETRSVNTFNCTTATEMDLTLSGFSVGEYVIVSSTKRLAIAAGCVTALNENSISISLERNLHKNHAGLTFIVDKYDSQSGNVFNFTNLGQLLEDTVRSSALRSIIVRREPPNFIKVLPQAVQTHGSEILQQLNSGQRAAVLKALTTESFMLIKGLPGTGKTQTLVAIVRLLQLLGKSVVITSHTHSAVDNLLLRLLPYNLPILRLGSAARLNAQLQACSEIVLTKSAHTVEELERIYAAYSIVGVTCLGAAHSIFLHRKFDYCIVDEATQVLQPTVLRPLFYCDKFILVGDPDQLPPLIRSREARARGADESLFQRLDTPQATAVLTLQYRMNRAITKLANNLTYDGALQSANKEVEFASIKVQLKSPAKWLQRTLQTHVDQSVFLLDTQDCYERSRAYAKARVKTKVEITEFNDNIETTRNRHTLYNNYCEAAIIFHIVHVLLAGGYAAERIGIIAPYRAQVELLRKLSLQLHAQHQHQSSPLNFADIEVNTVDQYQGRDKDIILYSGTRTGSQHTRDVERVRDAEILEDKRRLTVAITRSKMKLILVGDAACLQQYTPFHALLTHIPSYCKLQLQEGKLEFQWQALLEALTQVIDRH